MSDLGLAGQETTDSSRERLTPLFGRQVLLHRYALVHPPEEIVHCDLRLEQALLNPGCQSAQCLKCTETSQSKPLTRQGEL